MTFQVSQQRVLKKTDRECGKARLSSGMSARNRVVLEPGMEGGSQTEEGQRAGERVINAIITA